MQQRPTVDGWKVSKRKNLVHGLHLACSSNVKSLCGIVSVTDVRSDKSLRKEDGEEDVDVDVRIGWETDCNACSMRPQVLCATRIRRELNVEECWIAGSGTLPIACS